MSRRILKYTVPIQFRSVIEIYSKSKFLSAQEQHGQLTMWFTCDMESPIINHEFFVCGTGHEAPPLDSKFLATVQIREFVWHLFYGGLSK